jgi:hypothetical protein
VEDDVYMVVDDGGNLDEGWKGTPPKERLGYKKMPLKKMRRKRPGSSRR